METIDILLNLYRYIAGFFFLYLVVGSIARFIAKFFKLPLINRYTLNRKWVILFLAIYWVKVQIFPALPEKFFRNDCPDDFTQQDIVGMWVRGERYIEFYENGEFVTNVDMNIYQIVDDKKQYQWSYENPYIIVTNDDERFILYVFMMGRSIRIIKMGYFKQGLPADYGFHKLDKIENEK